MPSWGEILRLLQETSEDGSPTANIDDLRRGYIRSLSELTGRSTIVYAANFLNQSGPLIPITLQDMQGLMETFQDLPSDGLDLILHRPGGQAEATERLVT
jgi:hypothetical protein